MLEMIGTILLGYYLVVAVALLVFLAWRCIDNRRQANRRGRKARSREGARAPPGTGPERAPDRVGEPDAPSPDNVVKFPRNR